jgi:hypothetical protein
MKQDDHKPEQTVLLNGIPYTGDAAASGKQKNRRRRWKWLTAVSVLGIAMLVPVSAHAGIFDVFDELFGTIQSDIGSSLKSINQLSQQVQQLYQTTMWPLSALNQARGFVANSITAFRSQMNQIFSTQFTSAVTTGPQQFESILHSRLSAQIPALGASFTANYGSIPQQNSAAPQDLLMMDMDDALGQENLKTTLIADQGADTILQTANQMENQVAVTTPGSNPFLTAQAQVSNLRCQAYLQKMLAAQLRQEAGRIAHDNALLKRRTTITGGINSLITGALTAH